MTRSFVDSTLLFGETAELRARLQSDGYLLLRNIVPSDALDVLRSSWQDILETTTWLDPSSAFGPTTLRDGVFFNPIDENYRVAYHQVFALEALHALPHHSTIVHLVERLFGEPSLQLPVVVPRMIFPRLSEQRDMTSRRIRIFHTTKVLSGA